MAEELFKCEICGLRYREKEWAEKCRQWCAAHDSCNIEVIMHAVESEEREGKSRLKEG